MSNETTTLTRRTVSQGAAPQRPTTGAARAPAQQPAAVPGAHVERPAEEPGKPVNIFEGLTADFHVRDGDVLVVSYPEVLVPLSVQYSSARAGGHSYTRRLKEGDNVVEEAVRVHTFLKNFSEKDAKDKIRTWTVELDKVKAKGGAK